MTVTDFEALRGRAFDVSYRMLGSVAEAEDVVQETLLRVHLAQEAGDHLESPLAFVTTVATRLCLDQLRKARTRRETYAGEWLPEPLLTDERPDPAREVELAESLSMAFLALLERLGPDQRAALLLHDVFGYPYAEIAALLRRSETACRQLVSRARAQIRGGPRRFVGSPEKAEQLASQFISVLRSGDKVALESLLSDEVTLHGDGGGNVPALSRPAVGRLRVAATLLSWMQAARRMGGVSMEPREVNGGPGAVTRDLHGRLVSVVALEIRDGRICTIHSVVNPDKLRHLGTLTSLWNARPRRERDN